MGASLGAQRDSQISAAIVVRDSAHDGLPLLAFALTDPGHQRRGIGQRLIEESIARLDSNGVHKLNLAVTWGNPAARLYQRAGTKPVQDLITSIQSKAASPGT